MPKSYPDQKAYCKPSAASAVGDAFLGEIVNQLVEHPQFLDEVLSNTIQLAAPQGQSSATEAKVEKGRAHTTVPVDAQIVAVMVALATNDWVPLQYLRGFGSEPTLRKIAGGIETRIIDKKKCVRIREFLAERSQSAEEQEWENRN